MFALLWIREENVDIVPHIVPYIVPHIVPYIVPHIVPYIPEFYFSWR